MEIEKYFEDLEKGVRKEYKLANEAKAKGLDPVKEVEIPLAMSMAEKCVGLISTIYSQMGGENGKIISQRLLDLEQEYGQLDSSVPLLIAEEIARQKFCKFDSQIQAIDAGIRVAFAYMTLGVVASPLEGYTHLELGKTAEGKEYFIPNYSGPVRSAGGTGAAFSLVIIDYLRQVFGYAKYDPTETEVKRMVTEIIDYHEKVTNLQYFPTEEEIAFITQNLPIQVSGDPTEKKEVSNFKDQPRIPTNFIRGGVCLTIAEGLAQKAPKILRMIKNFKSKGLVFNDWDFLEGYCELHKKATKGSKDTVATYIKDLVAGRPVYGHPSRSGSFRFRYGRGRSSGFSAASIHPATMYLSNNFLSNGTQLKVEKPTKGCAVTTCDFIDGPIIKLKNGSVKKISDLTEAKKIYRETEEILYLGDILFPLGDVMNRNHELLKPGYVEEWWEMELLLKDKDFKLSKDKFNVSLEEAREISEKTGIALHPSYIFYWTQISKEDFFWLLDWMQNAVWNGKLLLPYSSSVREKFSFGKRALELLGVEHDVVFDNVVINNAEALLLNLGLDIKTDFRERISEIINSTQEGESVLSIINSLSKYSIKDKAGDFIGARMGRPEKAKLRKLTGSPNVLFPIGEQGGRFRSVNEAANIGFIKADFPIFRCEGCGRETIYETCEECGAKTQRLYYCPVCRTEKSTANCSEHGKCLSYSNRKIDSKHFFEKAQQSIGFNREQMPELIKGIRGTSSEEHEFENLGKGILRAKYNLAVNKDGTVRYDATELPLTHFKPCEVGTSIEKLKELGYTQDIYGKELVEENQILLLMPHDIILPSCPETQDERADDVFFNIANFVDEELERLYHLPRFYNLKTKDDLIGHLVTCMAPHNCAGVVGRIIGNSKLQGLLASPYMHAAMRRDCDGDEAAVMLLLDVLMNFSRKFLPSHRGGTQDAPLVLNARIRAGEVDDQILDFETCSSYPLDLYYLAEQRKHSSEIKLETVKSHLKKGTCPFTNVGFTHDTSNFNKGVVNSSYKILPTMKEKVGNQMELVGKIRAVDASDVARLIIERHFIRDIRGNLRKFSHQQFRCVSCNEKYRRTPLSGVCNKCGGKLLFTISEGSIKKYLDSAIDLATNYEISEYTRQSLELAKLYIESIFGKDADKQVDLKKWF
jgi:DNA polymerase II large subunit